MNYEKIERIIHIDPLLTGYRPELVNRHGQNRVYKLIDKENKRPSFYAKFTANDDIWGPASVRMHREVIATSMASNLTQVRVPESRIAIDPQTGQECLIQEELTGESFNLVISREKGDRKLLQNIAYQSGQTLSQLHQIEGTFYGEIVDGHSGRFETWDQCFCAEVERILVLARKNKILEPNQETFFTRKLAQGCPRIFPKPVLSHRDFTPQNIVADIHLQGVAGIIDFEVAQFWTQEWDITRTNAFLEYPQENKDLLASFIKGYAEHQNIDEKSLLEIIKFYKTFESLYYWVWGWNKGFREDITNDIKRVINRNDRE